jgi:hypothetical protein
MVISDQYPGRHAGNPLFRIRPNPNLSNTVDTVRYRTFRQDATESWGGSFPKREWFASLQMAGKDRSSRSYVN